MTKLLAVTFAAVGGLSAGPSAQTAAPVTQDERKAAQPQPTTPQEPAPHVESAATGAGLRDLDAMTFGCPKAGLNAAAREAAGAPSQGTYQFAYFKIINDSHHALYEVHFKSNYTGEPDLKYCVSVYCQQGWDPKTTKTSVRRMSNARQAGATHVAECGHKPPAGKRRPK